MENDFGKFIEKLRGKTPLREVAEKSGLSHTYIRDLELGRNRKTKAPIKPSPDILRSISKAYGHPFKDLMVKAGYSYDEKEEVSKEESEAESKRKKGKTLLESIKEEKLDHTLFLLEQLNKE